MRREKTVEVPFHDVLDTYFEDYLDLLLELAGDPLGMDIHYELVGVNTLENTLLIRVDYEVEDD